MLLIFSSVFDPLGFLAKFVIWGQFILKWTWLLKWQRWDACSDQNLNYQFAVWIGDLNAEEAFAVRIWYQKTNENIKNELNTFDDALESASCAVAYIYTETEKQNEKFS